MPRLHTVLRGDPPRLKGIEHKRVASQGKALAQPVRLVKSAIALHMPWHLPHQLL